MSNLFKVILGWMIGLIGIILSTIILLIILGLSRQGSQNHWFNGLGVNIRFIMLYFVWFIGAIVSTKGFFILIKKACSIVVTTISASMAFITWVLLMQLLQMSWWVK
jgi:hypothetical protein